MNGPGHEVYHNVVYGHNPSNRQGGSVTGSGSIKNNIFYNNGIGAGGGTNGGGGDYNYCYPATGNCGTNAITSPDPGMVDPANADFTLKSGSPLIDAGIDAGITTDYLGNTRPQGSGYDIGAYEYTSGGGDTTPPTTTASPRGGAYSSPQAVTLTASEPATTYYTADGSTPTTSSPVYTSPIAISQTTALKFFSRDTAGNQEAAKTETYTITPGAALALNPVADSWIQDENGASRDDNFGSSAGIGAGGRWATTRFRAFLRFDLSSIPSSATITRADLKLYHATNAVTSPNTNTISIYRLLKDWQESQVTWNSAALSSPWTAPGADSIGNDRDSAILASQSFTSASPISQYYTFTLPASLIQNHINNTWHNYGLILIGKETWPSADRYFSSFSSRESASNRPVLEITYTVPQYHRSDSNSDGCTSYTELFAFIDRWKLSSQDVTLRELIEAIGLWKGGC